MPTVRRLNVRVYTANDRDSPLVELVGFSGEDLQRSVVTNGKLSQEAISSSTLIAVMNSMRLGVTNEMIAFSGCRRQ